MTIIICPGMHNPKLTEEFLAGLFTNWQSLSDSGDLLIFPTEYYAPVRLVDH